MTLTQVFMTMLGVFLLTASSCNLIHEAYADTTWKKDRYGYETWRSSKGEVCKKDRYGDTVRCTRGGRR